jgi:hypothetical protein
MLIDGTDPFGAAKPDARLIRLFQMKDGSSTAAAGPARLPLISPGSWRPERWLASRRRTRLSTSSSRTASTIALAVDDDVFERMLEKGRGRGMDAAFAGERARIR